MNLKQEFEASGAEAGSLVWDIIMAPFELLKAILGLFLD